MNVLPASKSSYQDFSKCPRYIYNRKILGIQPPVGEAARMGVQFHKCISELIKGASEEEVRQKIAWPVIHDWLTLTMINRPLKEFRKADSEIKVLATRNLELVTDSKQADLIGIMDLVWLDKTNNILYVLDFKTGRYEVDSVVERHLYSALGRALQPHIKNVIFELYYVQTNRSLISSYSWTCKDKVVVIKDPYGKVEMLRDSIDPMAVWCNDIVEEMETSEGDPNPGRHCRNWYGAQCYYLQDHCPAYKNGRKIKNA